MVIINDLLKVTDFERVASKQVDLGHFPLSRLIYRLQALLVLDKLLFHEQVVLDSVLTQHAQPAS